LASRHPIGSGECSEPGYKDEWCRTLINHVATANGPLRLFACYNRPQIQILEEDLLTLFDGNTPTITAGDFNAKHINWGSHRSNRNGNILNDFTDQHLDISVMAPAEPTFYQNSDGAADILDVAIVKNVVHQVRLTAINDLSSDHNPVLMQIGNEANDPM
ncbi:putative RNA-directed DNA polymerase from transposon X-element-like protein, partial [Tribolium castaneum]